MAYVVWGYFGVAALVALALSVAFWFDRDQSGLPTFLTILLSVVVGLLWPIVLLMAVDEVVRGLLRGLFR